MITIVELQEAITEHGGIRPAARALGMAESTIRSRLNKAVKLAEMEPIPDFAFTPDGNTFGAPHIGEMGVDTLDFTTDWKRGEVRRYILTSAQNNCRVNKPFWDNLQRYAEHIDAKILVSFSVYDRANYRGLVPKGDTRLAKQDIWWDKVFQPHVVNQRVRLAKRLAFCGELDILATASDPLSSLDSYCGRSSIVVPHNKFRFKCVESRAHQMPKELYTTGSATEKRFIQRKTGQVAQFHHVIGALMVEVDADGYFWVHHINAAEDGSFQVLDTTVSQADGVNSKAHIEGLILGDIHHEKLDRGVAQETLMSIIPTLRPRDVVVHDLIDFTSRNHHNIKDPVFRVKMKDISIADEMYAAASFLSGLSAKVGKFSDYNRTRVHVIESNHDEALLRWVKETDWRTDPINAEFYLRTALEVIQRSDEPDFNLLRHALGYPQWANFIPVDGSIEISGIECGIHGHVGPSGSRGSPKGFSRLGFKSFTAHTHTPSIVDGCYTVGVTGKLDMEYNRGPSKWMHTHGIIYPNGKRGFVTIKNGKWRA